MQIQKMLNVFIIIFLGINIGLFFYLQAEDESKYTLSAQRVAQVYRILEANNVEMDTPVLIEFYPKAKLTIKEPLHSNLELVELIFGDKLPMIPSEEEYRYSTGDEELGNFRVLKIKLEDEKGRVIYTDQEPKYKSKDFTSSIENRNTAQAFTKSFSLGKGDYELTDERSNQEQQFRFYYYNERYEGQLLFCNEVRMKLEVDGITEATGIRYEPGYFDNELIDIYPPDEILYMFMSYTVSEAMTDVVITDLDIGYNLGPDGLHDLKSTQIEPYYRIKIGSGQTFYINAYTNELVVY